MCFVMLRCGFSCAKVGKVVAMTKIQLKRYNASISNPKIGQRHMYLNIIVQCSKDVIKLSVEYPLKEHYITIRCIVFENSLTETNSVY